MIVFEKDWKYYPNAIIDTQTRNQSFLRIARLYYDMGIKHWYFPLALYQPELSGVDFFDENLDTQTKAKVLLEADHNPWFYLRELVRDIKSGNNVDEQRFRANRGAIAAMWMTLACLDYGRVQPRQTGKSFESDVISIWLLYFCYRNTTVNVITNSEPTRKENIERLKIIRDNLPDYANRNTRKDDNNQITLSCRALGNKLFTHLSQSSEKAANNLGRGMTSPYIQVDEAPFINHIETTVTAAMGSMNAAREAAHRKGVPYATAFTTTAGDKESRDGRYVYNIIYSGAVWDEKFFDCQDRDELIQFVQKNSHSRAPMVNLTLSHRQIGISDEWLYGAIARARADQDETKIYRDYFNIWTSASTTSPIVEKIGKRIRESEKDPIDKWISNQQYLFYWYRPIDPNSHYILGIDTSDAIGRDDIATVLTDVQDGGVVGAGTYNETNLWRFAQWVAEFLSTYENTTLMIENRYNAQNIIDYLLVRLPELDIDPLKRIYSRIVQEKSSRSRDYQAVMAGRLMRNQQLRDFYKGQFGFKTGSKSRDSLYSDVLNTATERSGHLVHDSKLIGQLLELTVKNGRIDHSQGGHDDMVIAWLLCHWLIHFGVNLSNYGIDARQAMSQISASQDESNEEIYRRYRNQKIRDRIEQIYERLKQAQSQIEIQKLERELAAETSRLDPNEDQEVLTFDGLVEQARQERQPRSRMESSSGGNKTELLLRS